jgi:hypothetical protein
MKLDQRKILRWGPVFIGTWMILAVVASDADPEEGLPLGQEEKVPAVEVVLPKEDQVEARE